MTNHTIAEKRTRRLPVVAGVAIAAQAAAAALYYQRVLRPRMHDWGATEGERNKAYSGDELVPHARDRNTYAITVDAPATDVWPWIAQMGSRRGGWYSYDLLDNGGHPSAKTILRKHQHVHDGDVIPVDPKGQFGFPVLRVEPERHLVLGWPIRTSTHERLGFPGGSTNMIWAFHLIPQAEHKTRLIVRTATGQGSHPLVQTLFAPLNEAVVFTMQRKQLLGIKHRAEALYREREAHKTNRQRRGPLIAP